MLLEEQEYNKTVDELLAIQTAKESKESINRIAKTFVPGYLLEFPAVGCVMIQSRSRFYYRGENAYYQIAPTLFGIPLVFAKG
jgi:hypothetical protein